jgi:UDP-glucose 6-dehydrogenase
MKVSVIGATGWVGKAVVSLFPLAYQYTSHIGTKEEANKSDVAFICVPSPLKEIGQILDTSIVEDCIAWCKCPLLVVRSTVNPGDCDRWAKKYGKKIIMQPEYLGETPNHPLLNQKNNQFIILGGDKEDTKRLIDLYTTAYNANIRIRQVTRLEAEVIKLSENRAIAFKVMQCQELYDVCQKAGLDYYTIRDAVYGDDPRFNLWFSFIYPEKRGFNNSKCLRKDVPAFAMWAEKIGVDPKLTWALIRKSNDYETYGE